MLKIEKIETLTLLEIKSNITWRQNKTLSETIIIKRYSCFIWYGNLD